MVLRFVKKAAHRSCRLRHLDLFSGIGGFALAAQWAGIETVGFCEIEEFPRGVLQKNFPNVPIHHDIRELDGSEYAGIDIITGGYPCQPFSRAGKQGGEEDDRHLWPEMFRVIKQARPTFVLCENVTDHEHMGLDKVLADLESEGYATRPLVIPAGALQRDHARERLWVVAYNERTRAELEAYPNSGQDGGATKDSKRKVVPRRNGTSSSERTKPSRVLLDGETFRVAGQSEPLFLGSPHGVPDRMDRRRGLGNAIVPQVAYEIMRCFKAV